MTAEVTLGAGKKQLGGTSNNSSHWAWYWQKRENAPQSGSPGEAQIRFATSLWIITVMDLKRLLSSRRVSTGVVILQGRLAQALTVELKNLSDTMALRSSFITSPGMISTLGQSPNVSSRTGRREASNSMAATLPA